MEAADVCFDYPCGTSCFVMYKDQKGVKDERWRALIHITTFSVEYN
jgi:hypothetical protein